jgi:Cof subfamily protein (haloacid dehalogenase superfamily)
VARPTGADAPPRPTPEPLLPIRLIALDIDGTLLTGDYVMGERTKRAVRRALDRGVVVALATGRMASSAMGYADDLGLSAPLIAYQGGLIRDIGPGPKPGRIHVHTPLAADVARDVIPWATERGLNPHLNHLERFILREDDPNAEDYSRFMGARAELVPDLIKAIAHPVTKIIAAGDEAAVAAAFADGIASFAGRAQVTVSHPQFLEFLAPGVTKGRAVTWLARRSGVPMSQVMAIGDQYNDLEMLAAVGHGVAMPSAPAEVLAVARYVAPPVTEEGAAQMIERLVLVEGLATS